MQRVSPPSLRTRLHIDRHHHSNINRQRVNQPLHVSLCVLRKKVRIVILEKLKWKQTKGKTCMSLTEVVYLYLVNGVNDDDDVSLMAC